MCRGAVVKVRRATHSDIPFIVEIERLSFRYPYPEGLLRAYLALAGGGFMVAVAEGKVVGYVIGIIERGSVGHVISLAVRPGWRRRGIGKLLLTSLLRYFSERNVPRVYLEVRKGNEAAISLYRKCGFKEAGVIANYYPNGEDAVVMVLELDRSEKDAHG